jgi:hypothetical protein
VPGEPVGPPPLADVRVAEEHVRGGRKPKGLVRQVVPEGVIQGTSGVIQ